MIPILLPEQGYVVFAMGLALMTVLFPIHEPQPEPMKEKWSAVLSRGPSGKTTQDLIDKLTVKGDVMTPNGHKATLVLAKPQGINQKILALNLVFTKEKQAAEGLHWQKVEYTTNKPSNPYDKVTIKKPNGERVTIDVKKAK